MRFLRCGRFAALTPPAIATLLGVSSFPQEPQVSTIDRGDGPKVIKGNNGRLRLLSSISAEALKDRAPCPSAGLVILDRLTTNASARLRALSSP